MRQNTIFHAKAIRQTPKKTVCFVCKSLNGWVIIADNILYHCIICTSRMHSDMWLYPDRNVYIQDEPLRFKSFQKHLVAIFTLIVSVLFSVCTVFQ